MSDFIPSEYRTDFDSVDCPNCSARHPRGYELSGCGHPTCEVRGCHKCLRECDYSASCGHFCTEHLSVMYICGSERTLMACARCESEDIDDEPAELDLAANEATMVRLKSIIKDIEARKRP